MRGCFSYLSGVKKRFFVPLMLFSLKKVHSRSFCGTFYNVTGDSVLFWDWYLKTPEFLFHNFVLSVKC